MTSDDEGRTVVEAVANANALLECNDSRVRGLARHVLALAGMLGRGQPDRRRIPAGTYACTYTSKPPGADRSEAKLDAEGTVAWPLLFPFDGVPPMRVGDRFEVELVPAVEDDGG